MNGSISIAPADSISTDELRRVMSMAFDKPRPQEWFAWKHQDGPWGPSSGLVAIDEDGPAGVRMLLPWRLEAGSETVHAWRAIEASTHPRAQGRGIFSKLNMQLMDELSEHRPTLIFSTPNNKSRLGYAKLGWSLFTVIQHRYALAALRWRSTSLEQGHHVVDDYVRPPSERISTAWSPAALRWRIDRRCGHRYDAVRLRDAESSNGLVFRTLTRRGVRILLPIALWGSPAERSELLRAAAWKQRAPVTLHAARPTTGRTRQHSELAVYARGDWSDLNRDPGSADAWHVDFCDLEGVL